MNITSLGIITSAATSPLARGADVERISQDAAVHQREVQSVEGAEAAEGVGVTSEEQATSDRDADGRRPWEIVLQDGKSAPPNSGEPDNSELHLSKDPSGNRGSQLDLSG